MNIQATAPRRLTFLACALVACLAGGSALADPLACPVTGVVSLDAAASVAGGCQVGDGSDGILIVNPGVTLTFSAGAATTLGQASAGSGSAGVAGILVNGGTAENLSSAALTLTGGSGNYIGVAGSEFSNFGTVSNGSQFELQSDPPSGLAPARLDIGASGVFDNGGLLKGTGDITNNGALNNTGSITSDGGLRNNAGFSNSGAFTSSGAFSNYGTLSNLATPTAGGSITNNGTFTNNAAMSSQAGAGVVNNATMTHAAGASFGNDGAIDNYGQFTLAAGAQLTGGGTFTQWSGKLQVDGTLSQPSLTIMGGVLAGAGTLNTAVTIADGGILRPGDPVTMTINSPGGAPALSVLPGGVLQFQVAGKSAYDRVLFRGGVSLDHAFLVVGFMPGYVPAGGDSFVFLQSLDGSAISGWDTLSVQGLGGYGYDLATPGMLTVLAAVPEPHAHVLFAAGLMLMLGIARRRVASRTIGANVRDARHLAVKRRKVC